MTGRMKKQASQPPGPKKSLAERIKKDIKKNYLLYLMLLPGIIILICFKAAPVGAMVIAFQDFSAFKGILGSEWVGLEQFKKIFQDPYMLKLVSNTVILAVLSIVVVFPFPIIFSLFLNEVKIKKIRHAVQSLSFLPYFISSAIMVSILYTLVSPSYGLVNKIIEFFGGESIFFMAEPGWFRPLYIILQIWQTFGYSAVIYIAAMMAIDTEQYEAADMDGANRWQKMWYITLPSISSSVIVMLIISIGNIFSVDLDRILLMYNPSVYETADVIQTYVYRIAFQSTGFPDYSYGTAVNMLKSVIAFILVIIANKLAAKYSETRLF
ncbi:MAG TPA: ABC transporter permease subunit [Candidatus Eisenbergiella merdavium]|uniref:ABC transporter permease subunit n=1 Tax=Candidatus Eisenbergiella merdavium TaxID=2838551 RepID=A0A9D2NF13_9FIRM|nr:ABC transporter permease subunit [Candidatus Eisenbergiella merdavium]